MKKATLIVFTSIALVSGTAFANDAAPVELTAEQMDRVTAGYSDSAYGKIIVDAAGPFGQLIGSKRREDRAHANYAGGAKALAEAVLGGAHPVP